jgi:ribosomal protein S13
VGDVKIEIIYKTKRVMARELCKKVGIEKEETDISRLSKRNIKKILKKIDNSYRDYIVK